MPTKQDRKSARTRIYRAIFGEGGKTHNVAWTDPARRLPQGWDPNPAFGTFRAYKADAALPHKALVAIASQLGLDLKEVL